MIEVQPYNQEAEEAFVGAFFLDAELINECTVRPEQLFTKNLRLIYSAIRSLNEKGIPVDIVSLIEELSADNLVRVGGVHYISQLAGSVPTTANFHFYEKMVKEYDQKRKWGETECRKNLICP
ncbi:hypothetical protein BIV60_09955 [Bacillus sp. MUM 116]|uniref:DnaB-like helicase N-terminal domain-containing protein n=1 Tax=Bacillus sp. MUM 116 TaxID=1678002 RepID=UPI0008F574E4|nr:DnaB-like helicase N-terminal domain-containing protein [Bacillus sp. MUM 116]OIK15352.1 hypothetical protein BIV60_09955 [Bacillus sp. MUM 116]